MRCRCAAQRARWAWRRHAIILESHLYNRFGCLWTLFATGAGAAAAGGLAGAAVRGRNGGGRHPVLARAYITAPPAALRPAFASSRAATRSACPWRLWCHRLLTSNFPRSCNAFSATAIWRRRFILPGADISCRHLTLLLHSAAWRVLHGERLHLCMVWLGERH